MTTNHSPTSMFRLLALFALAIPLVSAWSFNISSRVAQCANLSVEWNGGVAPWELVLIPVGALQGQEIRTIVDANITSGNSYSFQLKFPTNSSFLAMMSDATGIGTGGTSVLISVLDGDDSCLATSATTPDFFLYLTPGTNPNQCSNVDVGWENSASQGQVRITAMIPGGESFALPVPTSGGASSFEWPVDIPQGTQYLIVAGDQRGFGTGGSSGLLSVQSGSSGCINQSSPSSTAAPAAGGIYATGSGGGSVTGVAGGGTTPSATPSSDPSGTASHSSTNIGAVVGGVVGGVAALLMLLLLILFFIRRRRVRRGQDPKNRKRDTVDLLPDEPQRNGGAGHAAVDGAAIGGAAGAATAASSHGHGARSSEAGYQNMSQVRGRASFSSAANTDGALSVPGSGGRPGIASAPSLPPLNFGSGRESSDQSHGQTEQSLSVSNPSGPTRTSSGVPPSAFINGSQGRGGRPTTPTSSRGGGKGAPPASMRPVNVIVHDDAGQVHQPEASASPSTDEVVELPPSYADVRRNSDVGRRPT